MAYDKPRQPATTPSAIQSSIQRIRDRTCAGTASGSKRCSDFGPFAQGFAMMSIRVTVARVPGLTVAASGAPAVPSPGIRTRNRTATWNRQQASL